MTRLSLTDEKINSHSGLCLAEEILNKFGRRGELFKTPDLIRPHAR